MRLLMAGQVLLEAQLIHTNYSLPSKLFLKIATQNQLQIA